MKLSSSATGADYTIECFYGIDQYSALVYEDYTKTFDY